MFTKDFWAATLERAIRTFAQTVLGLMLADKVQNVVDFSWGAAVSAAAFATITSILMSIVGNKIGNNGPSFATESIAPAYTPKHAADPSNVKVTPPEVGQL